MPAHKVRAVIAAVEAVGWTHARTRGDHRTFTKPGNPAIITISGKLGDDMSPGQLADVCRKAHLDKQTLTPLA